MRREFAALADCCLPRIENSAVLARLDRAVKHHKPETSPRLWQLPLVEWVPQVGLGETLRITHALV
ncbi:uncharacterized protein PHACADRAFT_266304, partial [Phanerochaete carnosa HHB-10118-sp]